MQLKPEIDGKFYSREAKDMVNVVQRLLMEGEWEKGAESAKLLQDCKNANSPTVSRFNEPLVLYAI